MSYRMKGSTFFQKPDDLKYWERWLKSRGATTKPAGMGSLDPESGYRVGNWLLRDPKDIAHIKSKSTRSTVFGTKSGTSTTFDQSKKLKRMKGRRLRREGGLIKALRMGPRTSRMYKAFRGAAGKNPWVKAGIGIAGAVGAYFATKKDKKKKEK